jgi:predicted AAA+ superfamily ATPase
MEINFRQIIAEQRDEIPLVESIGWVPREQEKAIVINSRLAQIITGVRRSGKSTLAHRALHETQYAYVNFDDERLTGLSAENLNDLLEALYAVYGDFTHLLLDEIQNVEGWHLFVNRLLRSNIRIVLTGSNSKLLNREMASHLTGRYSTIELLPFSFREFLVAKGYNYSGSVTTKEIGLLLGYFDEYTADGGLPELVTGEPKQHYINNLFEAIVTRDIIYRYNIRHVRTFRELAIWLTANFASEISYNRIKTIYGLGSMNTAKNYISFLEEAWLFIYLSKFSFKKQESLRYRKIYLIDTAFANLPVSAISPNRGRLLENVVFLELFRNRLRDNYEIYYYKKNVEVDFVIYSNRKVTELIQVTLSTSDPKTLNRELRALLSASKELNVKQLTIITLNEKREIIEGDKVINVIPVTEWLFLKTRGRRRNKNIMD